MSNTTDGIESTSRETQITPEVGEALQTAFGLAAPPRTFEECGQAIGAIARREGLAFDLDTLCGTDDSPHRAEFGDQVRQFICVQDAFIVPYVADGVERVEITTESPIRGDRIEAVVEDGAVETDPADAVMSFGVASDVSPPAENPDSPVLAYDKICPYGHAFTSEAAYEEWAATVDAVTMHAPLADAIELAAAIDRAVDEDGRTDGRT